MRGNSFQFPESPIMFWSQWYHISPPCFMLQSLLSFCLGHFSICPSSKLLSFKVCLECTSSETLSLVLPFQVDRISLPWCADWPPPEATPQPAGMATPRDKRLSLSAEFHKDRGCVLLSLVLVAPGTQGAGQAAVA